MLQWETPYAWSGFRLNPNGKSQIIDVFAILAICVIIELEENEFIEYLQSHTDNAQTTDTEWDADKVESRFSCLTGRK